jgi:hypothetical protein
MNKMLIIKIKNVVILYIKIRMFFNVEPPLGGWGLSAYDPQYIFNK